MSDHGESLGELGIFLHGLPYAFAPEAQKRVPFVAWLGHGMLAARRGIDVACLRGRLDEPLTTTTSITRCSASSTSRRRPTARARRLRAVSKGGR